MAEGILDALATSLGSGKPRDSGLTVAFDGIEHSESATESVAEYVDAVQVDSGHLLLVDRSRLTERFRLFHDLGMKIQTSGIVMELAYRKGTVPTVLEELRSLGVDVVGVSERAGTIPPERIQLILRSIEALAMEPIFEVGPAAPATEVSAQSLISKVREATELRKKKVMLEVPRIRGPRDAQGISWDVLNEVVGTFGPPNLIFLSPHEEERTELILEFGPDVNLAGVPFSHALDLQMQRLGLTNETFGLSRSPRGIGGSPASKFVYHLIRTEHPIDQVNLIARSGLPKRTVQAALNYLAENGKIREVADPFDLRRRKYTLK